MTPELIHAITDAFLALLGPVTATVIGIFAARRAGTAASVAGAAASKAEEHSVQVQNVVASLRPPVVFGGRPG